MGEILFSKSIPPVDRHKYEVMTYLTTNVTVDNNGTTSATFRKTGGSQQTWDAQAYSLTPFQAPCTIEFTKNAPATWQDDSASMIGWNVDPQSNASYTSIDEAAYPQITNSFYVYRNGNGTTINQSWSSSIRLYIVYDVDGFVRYYNGSTLLFTSNYGAGKTVYVDSSIWGTYANCFLINVKVSKWSWNGTEYVR